MAIDTITKKKVKTSNNREQILGMLFASIPIIGFVLFGLFPLIISLVMSFSNVPSYRVEEMEVFSLGNFFNNYITIFQDEKFWLSIGNTLIIAISLPVSMIIGLTLAVLLNQKIRGSKIFRTIFFIPFVCSVVAIALMWRTMLAPGYGIINQFLAIFGVSPISWFMETGPFLVAMVLMTTWCGIGFSVILYSAALTSIPPSLYEAAKMDGANGIQQFFRITFPLLSPTTFYLLVIGLIGSLQEFSRIQAITAALPAGGAGPNDAGLTIVFYLFNKFNEVGGLGQAAAVSWVLTIVIVILTAINFFVSKKWVYTNDKDSV